MPPSTSPQIFSIQDESVGRMLRKRRVGLGLTQRQVATRASISSGYLAAVENGRGIPPTPKTLERILAAIDVSNEEAAEILRSARQERGVILEDSDLPPEALDLVLDIRRNADRIDPRFLCGLRAKLREVLA